MNKAGDFSPSIAGCAQLSKLRSFVSDHFVGYDVAADNKCNESNPMNADCRTYGSPETGATALVVGVLSA